MKRIVVFLGLLVCIAMAGFGQQDTLNGKVKYSRDFVFKDGIFATFGEFKQNEPSITVFEVQREENNSGGEEFVLKYAKIDSTGAKNNYIISRCFGFCKDGVLYLSQGDYGYYRMFIIGALSHYMAYNHKPRADVDAFGDPTGLMWSADEFSEYLLVFETGKTFLFTYQNFRDFLKVNDADLYQQLESSKNKRDMIHHFLLLYNDKHPIYFPMN